MLIECSVSLYLKAVSSSSSSPTQTCLTYLGAKCDKRIIWYGYNPKSGHHNKIYFVMHVYSVCISSEWRSSPYNFYKSLAVNIVWVTDAAFNAATTTLKSYLRSTRLWTFIDAVFYCVSPDFVPIWPVFIVKFSELVVAYLAGMNVIDSMSR